MDKLHPVITESVKELRRRLAAEDIGGSFRLDIEISGRIQEGDVKVAYLLGHSYESGNARGSRLAPVVEEFVRRHAWDRANEPLALEAPAVPDEVPY